MRKTLLLFLLAAALGALAFLAPLPLGEQARAVLAVLVFCVTLWVTEAIPLHATALLLPLPLVLLAQLPEREVFAAYFDPVIVLLLGGFVIAVAMEKHGLDRFLAHAILGRFGTNPAAVLFGLLLATAAISMWISNTAAAAIMMPIAVVILRKNRLAPGKSRFGKAAVLAIAYGATIGGIGTIVGSTPNVIAAKHLASAGVPFGFMDWLARGFPMMLVLVAGAWLVLLLLYRPETKLLRRDLLRPKLSGNQRNVLLIFLATIALWVTESVHGISSAGVALVPVALFYLSGLLGPRDFAKVDWKSLVLVGGGLALGVGIHASGLDAAIASVFAGDLLANPFALFLALGLVGVALTSFVSNTTASAVYIPIVVALASVFGVSQTNAVVAAAIGVSLDFIFPFGTPPSAIAYGTRYIQMKDLAKAGLAISLFGALALAGMGMLW